MPELDITDKIGYTLLKKGIITNAAHETVLRLLPPFIISNENIDEFLKTLDQVLSDIESEQQGPDK